MPLFYGMHAILLIAAICTWKHTPPRDPKSNRVTFLSRGQTEEWKGWMQFTFIMYHYYRAWSSYNWIRTFVSSYVWMTGFGNFLYFDKKKDFSLERIVSMCIRINYFPILLSLATGVSFDLYYVVPLHTEGFFMTMLTCRLAVFFEDRHKFQYWSSRALAIAISLAAHVLFFETRAVDSLLFVSKELHFRFQSDKYSAIVGIACGALMQSISRYMTWAYGNEGQNKPIVHWGQRIMGVVLIVAWYKTYGHIPTKEEYNPFHPYIFALPLIGWLMIRNSSRYLTECHSTFLEFLGRNTLETYVLQFHLFMNHSVQRIPIIIPGSGSDGGIAAKMLNMLLCGTVFVMVAIWARKVTVTTQTTVVDLMKTMKARKVDGEREVLAEV
eukprot:CAMPEP_0198250178 /NCGR_PEP_ID=MMETSP1447-20131203/1468_1 /TAXON_ID=420782 /ORGANISM="Chaetoceros dichaeta, Strain CCMP1751" /LENGTH=382 /DNA_ID=CAMNT_0043934979 /DNA_START=8 /DNA_END=1156 /DNA_ORIENTATION=-